MSFSDLGLSDGLLTVLAEIGYTEPTPIQAGAIPSVLMGRDVLGCAQTGTGKTASFTLPMIDILAEGRAKTRMPRSLIISPTRELAAQIADNFTSYGKYNKLSMALLIGGESFKDQEQALMRGVDVLIATPGRLLDLFERGAILLNDLKILVIDEADRMLDMGFIPDVERIASLIPANRQTLFFSATMPPEIKKLADAFLTNPKEVTVSKPQSTADTVTQRLVWTKKRGKRATLRALLEAHKPSSAFIFCNRKRDIGELVSSLQRHGYGASAMHGDMSQPERMEALARFKAGESTLLVCSDVAARGIDVSDVAAVFNFDVPLHAEDYVHRIGRTGRAGKSGLAFSLASELDEKLVTGVQRLIGKEIEVDTVNGVGAESLEALATHSSGSDEKRERGGRSRSSRAERDETSSRGRPARAERSEAAPRRRRHADDDEPVALPSIEETASFLPNDLRQGADFDRALIAFERRVPAFMLRAPVSRNAELNEAA